MEWIMKGLGKWFQGLIYSRLKAKKQLNFQMEKIPEEVNIKFKFLFRLNF